MPSLTGKDTITTAYHQIGSVEFLRKGAYANLTQMAKPFEKRLDQWMRLKRTKAYLRAFKKNPAANQAHMFMDGSNPVTASSVEFYDGKRARNTEGEFIKNKDIFAHPYIALEFAQWLDPEFSLWCNIQIVNLLTYGEVNLHYTEWRNRADPEISGMQANIDDLKELHPWRD